MSAGAASAHVVVKPNSVGVAAFLTFTVGVPNEKDTDTVGVRLVLPGGLAEVSPSVKPGWTIAIKKEGDGDNAKVTEINWTGGSIPAEQRDDFTFSAQVPASPTTLQWKAYQTYKDGTVVSWDQDPSSIKKGEEGTPFSTTAVVNDLGDPASPKDTPARTLGIVALALSVLGLAMQWKGQQHR